MDFLELAQRVSIHSKCQRRKIGAVLVLNDDIIGLGWNPGRDCGDMLACPRGAATLEEVPANSDYTAGPGLCNSKHAEVAAIEHALGAGYTEVQMSRNAVMYVSSTICPGCQKLLQSMGIEGRV